MVCNHHGQGDYKTKDPIVLGWTSELVNKSPREARVFLGVSGKAREPQYLGV